MQKHFSPVRKENRRGRRRKRIFLLNLVNDEETRQKRPRVKHDQCPIFPTHRVKRVAPTSATVQERVDPLAHPTRDDPADEHRPPPPPPSGALVGGSAPRKRTDRPTLAGECAEPAGIVHLSIRGPHAVESHHLVPIGDAASVLVPLAARVARPCPSLDRLSILLEPGYRLGQVLDLEDDLDPARERLLAPAGVEYDLHHVARGMPLGQLGQGREERVMEGSASRDARARGLGWNRWANPGRLGLGLVGALDDVF
eukprot:TRINITY_DN58410_c0_g1_i1.p2 TRINITY_DN58410_c0_g1~~TRINITY_DN58410_c0_g1_i1.p2  ORF type:complete len:255 (+),score=26.63 TRINITY_DN58410_c0_g1_i1:111-875(+)